MRQTDIPSKIQLPFATSAGGGYIRTVPVPSQIGITNGAASFTDGFPPLNFLPVAAGGVPPFGQDFNGLLNVMSAWNRWEAAAGQVMYDLTFATAVGGYPSGATLLSTTGIYWFLNCVDNNTSNPDTGGAGWAKIAIPIYLVDTGTADALAVATPLLITSWTQLVGIPIFIQKQAVANATSTPTVTLTANGVNLGAKTVVRSNGSSLNKNDLVNGAIQQYFYDGAYLQVMDPGGGAPVSFSNRFTDTTPGTRNFTAAITGPHRISICGSGGGGGGGVTTGVAGGAGGGGYLVDIVYLVAGTLYSYTIGTGGTGAAAGTSNNGVSGGSTTFTGPAGTLTVAGGTGGFGAGTGSFGLGGAAGGGSGFSSSGYQLAGQTGYQGSPQIAQAGAGGAGAAPGSTLSPPSFGGGNPGIFPGGGGSGSTTSAAGGAGANGQMIIEW